ncbi:ABC transporter ATP-binding protein [Aquirufa ecclesiirivi]|uniref:ABC transporter ATP-binding protein n=1 Tax=Aquirufa ecclesiirivi TaxID=2715124 RepID=UPI0023D8813F|nr:ABC transporter ATP-binding protein [Aquirufa ecclesiirivi]MDF0694722.1 ABC transporter ATP-binding protein [Aquirufa ecclesiirivi]
MKFSIIRDFVLIYKLLFGLNKKNTLFQLLIAVILALIPTALLFVTKNIFDQFNTLSQTNTHSIITWIAILISLQIFQSFLTNVDNYISFIQEQKITNEIVYKILNKAIAIPYTYYEEAQYQDSLHIAQQQSQQNLPLIYQNFKSFLTQLLTFTLLMIYFFTLIKTYAWLILCVAAPLGIIKWYSGFALHRLDKKLVSKERESFYLIHLLTGSAYAKELRTLNFGTYILNRLKEIKSFIFLKKNQLQQKLISLGFLTEILELSILFYILYGLAQMAFAQSIGISLFIVYIQGIQRIQSTLKLLLNSLLQLFQQRRFIQDFNLFLTLDREKPIHGNISMDVEGTGLEIKHVDFQYPGSTQKTLEQINLTCQIGQTIAIVGMNGAGKTTLIKLLAGLYSPSQGEITWNGHRYQELNADHFKQNSLFVFQDFEKYFLQIKEIIAMGNLDQPINMEAVQQAARLADAEEFIQQLPQSYDTRLGKIFESGHQISGGQWQKLAIARAFYRPGHLIVLDEPTSALDAISEATIFQNFKQIAANRATIIITHRLYNLKLADYIYVMDEGKIVEKGSFDELKNKNGLFKQLYDQQMV